jgi:mono/diheme cytochrome c family protein
MWTGARVGAAVLLLLGGCADESAVSTATNGDPDRGKQIYLAQCIACHNPDPSKEGPLAPPVKGASQELLEARVVRGTYPPGYTPRRETSLMQPMPQLAPAIPHLTAFLK